MKPLFAAAFAILLTAFATVSVSAEIPYDRAQFDSMRAAGKPVAVVFHADWCPTCRAQAPVLRQLSGSQEFKTITVFIANFDTEKDLKRDLRITQQSTVVVFKDGKEAARSTGDTRADGLSELLRHAIS
jgi:thioredoxin 1